MNFAAKNMTERIQTMQDDVRQRLEASNAEYKEVAHKKRCEKITNERDLVLIYLWKELFLIST